MVHAVSLGKSIHSKQQARPTSFSVKLSLQESNLAFTSNRLFLSPIARLLLPSHSLSHLQYPAFL